MMQPKNSTSQFKVFRDTENKLIISYWVMNAGETFLTCDLFNIKTRSRKDQYQQIEDYGCTFLTQGSCTCQTLGSDEILEAHAGEYSNRRRKEEILVTALEDNTIWCYCLHFDSLFTTDETRKLDWDCPDIPKVLTGKSIKIASGETIQIVDYNYDTYIANPIYNSEPNTILYKKTDENDFTSLDFGKYLKIEKGTTLNLKSSIDTYIPKVYYSDVQ